MASKSKLLVLILFLSSSFFASGTTNAAETQVQVRDASYSAKFVSQSENDPIEIEAGIVKTIIVKFKNIGTAIWPNTGSHFVSAYTMEPRERDSVFKGLNWISAKQTGKFSTSVKPGAVGELAIELKAPEKIGEYVEKFYLAAENYTWIKGGYFYLKIKVKEKSKALPVVADTTSSGNTSTYKMKQLVLSKKSVSGIGGDIVKMIVVYQNKGLETWSEYKLSADNKQFADNSWLDEVSIASSSEQVLPEKFLRLEFYFRLPPKKGDYNLQLTLQIDQGKGFETFFLPVSAISNAPIDYVAPFSLAVQPAAVRLEKEPNIRVGIAAPESSFLQFRSYEDDYKVYAGNTLLGVLPMRKFAVLKFSNGQYSFSGGNLLYNGGGYLRLEPSNNLHAVFHVPNLISREAKWVDPNKKFNYYRGALEYRQGTIDKKMYIVNDLLLEDYVRGMAENSRSAPLEFVKANLVAARTYAYVSKGKYPFFDVVGNTFDQLYLGYEAEEELPNVIAGAEATRGMMVTYNSEIITTPYFACSNGWTKSWSAVWGGASKPWLVPVKANYDTGRKQRGHGVGMSQLDAAERVEAEGLNYIDLLKYYYTGTEVERIYE